MTSTLSLQTLQSNELSLESTTCYTEMTCACRSLRSNTWTGIMRTARSARPRKRHNSSMNASWMFLSPVNGAQT